MPGRAGQARRAGTRPTGMLTALRAQLPLTGLLVPWAVSVCEVSSWAHTRLQVQAVLRRAGPRRGQQRHAVHCDRCACRSRHGRGRHRRLPAACGIQRGGRPGQRRPGSAQRRRGPALRRRRARQRRRSAAAAPGRPGAPPVAWHAGKSAQTLTRGARLPSTAPRRGWTCRPRPARQRCR
jgi:hypothetical protein